MPTHTHSPKAGFSDLALASSFRESLVASSDRDPTWAGDDRTPVLAAARRDQPLPEHRPEIWRASFESATASAMAIQTGWLAEELASGALLQPRGWGRGIASDWLTPDGLGRVFREGGNFGPIWDRANGADTAVVALTWVDENQGIFTRTSGGIRELAGLKGARLGLPRSPEPADRSRAVALRGLLTALEMARIPHDQVTFVDVAKGGEGDDRQQIDALLSGQVDAIFLRARSSAGAAWNPRLHELIDFNQNMDPLVRVNSATLRPLVVDRAFLESHREVVVRYLTVLLRTSAWAESHHDEVVRLLSTEVGGFSAEEVVEVYGPDVHRAFTPALAPSHVGALEAQKDFLRDWRFLPADFSIANWVVTEPLAEARERTRFG